MSSVLFLCPLIKLYSHKFTSKKGLIKLSGLERYNKLKEELNQEYNKTLNSEMVNASKLMYEYLGDLNTRIDFFNEEDYAVLQQRLTTM